MTYQAYLDNIQAQTGKSPEDFKALAAQKGYLKPDVKAGEVVSWLKKDFGLGHGLWIVPSHGVHSLGMRYPIDLVYLSEDKTVLHIEENVKPWRVAPLRMDAATVLELPCHTIWNTDTAVGDQIEIGFAAEKKPAGSVPPEFRPDGERNLEP